MKWGRPKGFKHSDETKKKISESVKKAFEKHKEKKDKN